MPQSVEQALSEATFYSDGETYSLVKLPPRAITAASGVLAEIGEPFCALIADKDEVTLLVVASGLEAFSHRLPEHAVSSIQYRLITIDVELDPELTGFMARISNTLAAAGVSILPYAAYTRDHVFVSVNQFDTAMMALEQLKRASVE